MDKFTWLNEMELNVSLDYITDNLFFFLLYVPARICDNNVQYSEKRVCWFLYSTMQNKQIKIKRIKIT